MKVQMPQNIHLVITYNRNRALPQTYEIKRGVEYTGVSRWSNISSPISFQKMVSTRVRVSPIHLSCVHTNLTDAYVLNEKENINYAHLY